MQLKALAAILPIALLPFASLAATASVPPDPHEPVTGSVQAVTSPADHAATLYLLERARQNSLTHNRGMQPYRFSAAFNAIGSANDSGSGELTETWMNGQNWRWTANLASTSVVRIANRGRLVESTHVPVVPMRAHMLRNEIFWAIDEYTVKAQLRTAAIQLNGKPATCILASGMTGAITQTQGRLWQEEEYCVDNDSGLLLLHSIAPGTFALFSYGAHQQFHDRIMPDRITVYVNGTLAVDSTFSIADPGSSDQAAILSDFNSATGKNVIGVQMPVRFPIAAPGNGASGVPQSVMIHAEVNGEGKVVEEEVSASGDPSLTQAALDLVKSTDFGPTATQRQMYLNVTFGR